MKSNLFFQKTIFTLVITMGVTTLTSTVGKAQILKYTDDTLGALNLVDPHATGTSLSRVNGAILPTTICMYGFSSRAFPTSTSYATSLPAVEVSASPNSGYRLNCTGFTLGIRRSNTGPANVRFAYSTDAGTTWIDQGTDQNPNNAVCDSVLNVTWNVPITVNYPNSLKFRVFGFNATGTSGTFQIMNLTFNGTVTNPVFVESIATEQDGISLFPNPMTENSMLSYHLNSDDKVSVVISDITGRIIQIVLNEENQQAGDYNYKITVPKKGLYFVSITKGNKTEIKKLLGL